MTARAAIDIGTISTRMLVETSDGVRTKATASTHLGAGRGSDGRLTDEAIDRVITELTGFRAQIDEVGISRMRAAATAAVRQAPNGAVLLDRAEEILGVRPEVLDGTTEAELASAGALADLPDAGEPTLVIDLGGGSCEFALSADGELIDAYSAPIGASALTEAYLHSDPPLPEELVACLSIVEAHMDDVRREIPRLGEATTVVGVAGTMTTMAAVEIGLAEYSRDVIHGFVLDREAAEDVFRTLVTEPLVDRLHNPGLREDRAVNILGGSCLVVGIMRYLGIDELVMSDDGLLVGLLESIDEIATGGAG